MTFEQIFNVIPGSADFVANMPRVWPFSLLQDIYAPFGALHLVGLGLMGGAVILLNLRLMGAGLKEEPLPLMEKTLRPWLISGLAIVLFTGIIIGMLNSEKLYNSVPFFVKMVSSPLPASSPSASPTPSRRMRARRPTMCLSPPP